MKKTRLNLKARSGSVFHIGMDVELKVIVLGDNSVQLCFNAPPSVLIDSDENRKSKMRKAEFIKDQINVNSKPIS